MADDTRGVLVVSADPIDTSGLDAALSDPAASISVLSTPADVFDELTRSVYHCLVLPASIDGQPATEIAYGITTMFPDLPVVLVGVEPVDVPESLDVVGVPSDSLVGDPVADAIREGLRGEVPAVAGRPPSPMETLLLSLFDEFPDHLYAKDAAARHVLMGRGFNEPLDRLGRTDPEVPELADEHGEAAYRDEMDVIERAEQVEVEEFLDLEATYVNTCKVPWYDADGEVRGLAGRTQDITDWRESEHAYRRQHERLVKVALVAAHELRNELQIAHGRLELLADDAHADRVQTSLSRISSLVDTVVELSNVDEERRERKPVWLSRLSREIWDTLGTEGATLDIADDARVVADQESAGLLLLLLFQNALEHAGPDLTVTVGTTDHGFYVADDGLGIGVDPAERVFEAGYTSDADKTGFGLYIARMVTDDLGWTIDAGASGDGGARFDIGNVDLDP